MPRHIRGPFEYLDDAGTQAFSSVMEELLDGEFTNIIITTENHDEVEPTDENTFSAAYILSIFMALWELIASIRSRLDYILETDLAIDNLDPYRHLHIQLVTGNIEEQVPVTDPDVLYFQHDDEEDDTWNLCVNGGTGWMIVGETKDILENYWSKDVTPAEIGMQIIPVLDDETIMRKVETQFRRVVKNY